jgi:hypothetical protein
VAREPTREQLRETALRAGEAFVTASLAGTAEPEMATALLPAALGWLRAEVDEEAVDPFTAVPLPREALRTLLIIFEELQELLPLAIASLVDDALAEAHSGIPADERVRARWELLSRRLLTTEELAALPREALISRAVQRFQLPPPLAPCGG